MQAVDIILAVPNLESLHRVFVCPFLKGTSGSGAPATGEPGNFPHQESCTCTCPYCCFFREFPFHAACWYGNVEEIHRILSGLEDQTDELKKVLASLDSTGRTPLSTAIASKKPEVVEVLLEKGAGIDGVDRRGRVALHCAVSMGSEDTVELLLRKGANVDVKDWGGQSPLHYAAYFGHLSIVKLLVASCPKLAVEKSEDLGLSPLCMAVQVGRLDIVKWLVETCGTLHHNNLSDNLGYTPLLAAVELNQVDIVAFLCTANKFVLVNQANNAGETPLSVAAKRGHLDVVKLLLLNATVDASVADNGGRAPLWVAAREGRFEVVQAFEALAGSQRVKIDQQNNDGDPPFYAAALGGHVDIVAYLLGKGADVWLFDDKKLPRVLSVMRVPPVFVDSTQFREAIQAIAVVAALMATMSYFGWLNPPGGFSNGMTMLESDACNPTIAPSGTDFGTGMIFNATIFSFNLSSKGVSDGSAKGVCGRYGFGLWPFFFFNALAFYTSMVSVTLCLIFGIDVVFH